MGTSVSKSSPRTSNWKRVFVCYQNKNVPETRVLSEIWRASENETKPLSDQIKSSAIYSCFEVLNTSKSISEALQKFNNSLVASKNNSIIAEFAKRAIPIAFSSQNPPEQWAKSLFSEITSYVISRDASGFVGEGNRNKTVNELIDFKRNITDRVSQSISLERGLISSKNDWNSFVDNVIQNLKN